MLPRRREVGLACLGLSFVVSALPTEKKTGYRETRSNPMLAVRDQPASPATANKSTSHLKIVIISIAALIVVCALAFGVYRWRSVFARLRSFKRQKRQPSVIITSPLGGFAPAAHHRGGVDTPSPMSESRYSDVLFGGGSYDMPARPVPAKKRAPQPTTLGTFFLAGDDEDDLAPLTSSGPRAKLPPSRKTKRQSLKLAIEPSSPPPAPNGSAPDDSPAAAKEMTRFSWGTSLSEKPRFRTVDSWVGNQAERWNPEESSKEEGESGGGGGGGGGGGRTPVTLEPSTPAVCRQHPGVPVELLTKPERVNSMYLDRRLGERY